MITVAQMAVGTFYVSGVPFVQYVRALFSCIVVGFWAVSRLALCGHSSNMINGAQRAVGTFCVSGVPIVE
jgi:hypothetical protein